MSKEEREYIRGFETRRLLLETLERINDEASTLLACGYEAPNVAWRLRRLACDVRDEIDKIMADAEGRA